MSSAIHSFDDDAQPTLEAMGLTRDMLEEVCRHGLAAYLTVTPHHPSNAAGSLMYFEMVRSLRDLGVLRGWECVEEGLALTVNEELGIAIVVSPGDIHVGNPLKSPSFKYQRGPVTHAAVVGNVHQLGLADQHPGFADFEMPATSKRVDFSKFTTWVLLHHVDTGKGVMMAELSLPIRIGDSGETDQWEARIILDSISFDEDPDVSRSGDDAGGADFDVEVRKKA